MKLYDINFFEIAVYAYEGFVESFSSEDESSSEVSNSDSDSDFNPDMYDCGDTLTDQLVEENWEMCHPLKEVYGKAGADMIKQTLTSATEESQCAGLKLFGHITPNEDRHLLTMCTSIVYTVCCGLLNGASEVVREATTNLLMD